MLSQRYIMGPGLMNNWIDIHRGLSLASESECHASECCFGVNVRNVESYGYTRSERNRVVVPLLVPAHTSRTLYAADVVRLSFFIDNV